MLKAKKASNVTTGKLPRGMLMEVLSRAPKSSKLAAAWSMAYALSLISQLPPAREKPETVKQPCPLSQ